jgi:hypothetical protein
MVLALKSPRRIISIRRVQASLADNPALFAEAILRARNSALFSAKLQVPVGGHPRATSSARNEPGGVVAIEVVVSWLSPAPVELPPAVGAEQQVG